MSVMYPSQSPTHKHTPQRHTEAIPAATEEEGGRAVVCVSADPKVRGLALCAEGAGGGRRQLVVDPLASRVEMEALVAGGKCILWVC